MNGEGGDESWLTSWEQQCVDSMEEQPNYEQSLIGETNISQTKTWTSFQDSATAVAQLYRDRYSGEPAAIWVQFQTAAGTVTSLYRESCESLKKTNELAKQSGYQKRNIELFNWAKRKRRLIRREDLLAYLAENTLHHLRGRAFITIHTIGYLLGHETYRLPQESHLPTHLTLTYTHLERP